MPDMKTLEVWQANYVALFTTDVLEFPECYKASVVADPQGAARAVIEGLGKDEVRGMLRDLRAERRMVAKATGGK